MTLNVNYKLTPIIIKESLGVMRGGSNEASTLLYLVFASSASFFQHRYASFYQHYASSFVSYCGYHCHHLHSLGASGNSFLIQADEPILPNEVLIQNCGVCTCIGYDRAEIIRVFKQLLVALSKIDYSDWLHISHGEKSKQLSPSWIFEKIYTTGHLTF